MNGPRIELTASGLTHLAELIRLVQTAEAIHMPPTSTVTVSGVNSSVTIGAYLSRVKLPDEVDSEPCYDSACVLGEHEDDQKHYDGADTW